MMYNNSRDKEEMDKPAMGYSRLSASSEAPVATSEVVPDGQQLSHVVLPSSFSPQESNADKHRKFIVFGAVLIIVGILSMTWNVTIFIVEEGHWGVASIGHGLWCGAMDIITGGFGIAVGKRKSKGRIISFMVLCTVAAAMNILQLIFGFLGASESRCNRQWRACVPEIIAMNSLLAVSALVAGIIAICGSAFSCTILCGERSSKVGLDGVRFMVVSGGPGSQPQAAMPVFYLAPGPVVAGNHQN